MVQQRRLSSAFAHKISHWRHSGGFQVYCSQTVQADDRQALERLAAYILRPSFAATRLRYQPSTGQVHYRTAKGVARSMDALDWIAQVISLIPNPHIPDPGAQMVRYYGWYSNASRGKRRLAGQAAAAKASSDKPKTEADGFFPSPTSELGPAAAQDLRSRPLNLFSLPRAHESRGPHRTAGNYPPDPPASEALGSSRARPTAPTLCSQAGPVAGLPLSGAGSPGPALHRFHLLGRRAHLAGFLRPTRPGIDGSTWSASCFCPRSVALLLYSSPSLTLPFYIPKTPGNPGPHGPLLAHLDPHFSTCYPQLEKQIPILRE